MHINTMTVVSGDERTGRTTIARALQRQFRFDDRRVYLIDEGKDNEGIFRSPESHAARIRSVPDKVDIIVVQRSTGDAVDMAKELLNLLANHKPERFHLNLIVTALGELV